MRWRAWAAAAALASAWAGMPAHAQVYRCAKDGVVSFSDKPCDSGPGQVVNTGPASPQGQLKFDVVTRHYPVSGANLAAAYASMRANGPQGWAGVARWNVSYRYDSKEVAGGCLIHTVAVDVVGDIQMPRWNQLPGASVADRARWDVMYANLKRHEDGHIQHGREFAMLLKEKLLGIGPTPCEQLQARADREYSQLYGNLQKRDQEYDARTDHGLRQDNPR